MPGAGRLEMTYTPEDGGEPTKFEIFNFKGAWRRRVVGGCTVVWSPVPRLCLAWFGSDGGSAVPAMPLR